MKQLGENSFQTSGNMTSEELLHYLDENGEWYFNKGNDRIGWCRTHLHEYDYNFLTHEDLLRLQLEDFVKDVQPSGTEKKPMSPSVYNSLACYDEWHGGYVDGFGYIAEETSSSMYGNSVIIGNSLVPCNSYSGYVRVGKFYQLRIERRWRGGTVSGWGYISENTSILGSSQALVEVHASERTLGAIANVGRALEQNENIEGLREQFKDCWNAKEQMYKIGYDRLTKYFSQQFQYSPDDNISNAVASHRPTFVRQITQKYDEYGETRNYGTDSMLLDNNALKQQYECLNPCGLGIFSIAKRVMNSSDVITSVFKKK